MAECKYRAPSMILVDDLDTLCHIPQDIANVAEDNHLTSLASSFCHALLSRFHEVEITEKLSDLKVCNTIRFLIFDISPKRSNSV